MNLIFISPNDPSNYWHFCRQLKNQGVNVLGIGDSPYDTLTYSLRDTLTEYYRVDSLKNYDQMVRAVGYFTFKYGKIDWIESNNEYFLRQDARLRTDFHITTGCDLAQMTLWQSKSAMKPFYRKAGVAATEYCPVTDRESCLKFAEAAGYPVVAKPDFGYGTEDNFYLDSREKLEAFLDAAPKDRLFVIQPYLDGELLSYYAITDSKGRPLFESGVVMPFSPLDCMTKDKSMHFYTEKVLSEDLKEAGRKCLAGFQIAGRMLHLDFIRLKADMEGVAKKGSLVGLELKLHPSGSCFTDMLNYGNSTDVYRIWSEMAAYDERKLPRRADRYYSVYIGRKDRKNYLHSHEELLSRYRAEIMMSDRVKKADSVMGDQMYIGRFAEKEQMEEFIRFGIEEAK